MTRRADGDRRGRMVRRVLLSCLIAAAAGLLWGGVPRECRDAVAGSATVSLCGPIGVADLRVGLFLIVAGALLLGEAGEVQVAGLLTLKARVAEATADAAEARREVAELRLAVGAAAGAAASAQANVYVVDRQAATGEVVDLARNGDAPGPELARPVPPARPEVAAAAFHAAFSGLRVLLPPWARAGATIIGYTVERDGRYAVQAHSGAGEGEGAAVAAVIERQLSDALLDIGPDRWLAAVRVADDAGRHIGALAVVLHDPPAAVATAERDRVEAAVEVAGAVYARLLVDILGEYAPNAESSHRQVPE